MENKYPSVIVTVDAVVLTVVNGKLHALIHKRAADADVYPGAWALPGGFVHADTETVIKDTLDRVLESKAGVSGIFAQQFFTYANATRDPRGWSASIAYYAVAHPDDLQSLAPDAKLVDVDELPSLSFDHNQIVQDAVAHVRNKANYSNLPCFFLKKKFTLTELQKMYELITGRTVPSFRRRVEEWDFLEDVEDELLIGNHRPAQYYSLRRGVALVLFEKSV